MVGSASKRLSFLTRQYEEISQELETLERKILVIQDYVKISQMEIERKVLVRKQTDTRIRMMNLTRDQNSPVKSTNYCNLNNATLFSTPTLLKLVSKCDNNNNCDEEIIRKLEFDSAEDPTIARELLEEVFEKVTAAVDQTIDYEDEYFNPMEVEFKHQRPVQQDRPTVPLPHSTMFWPRKVRIGNNTKHVVFGYNSTMHDHNGQFRSVEDEIAEVDWDNMMRSEVRDYHRNRFKSRGHYRPTYNRNVKANNCNVDRKEESTKVMAKAKREEDCICQRQPGSIICSGQDCSYSFIGRLAVKCPAHPGDNYLMDHAHPCPDCGGILVEAAKIKKKEGGLYPDDTSTSPIQVLKPSFKSSYPGKRLDLIRSY